MAAAQEQTLVSDHMVPAGADVRPHIRRERPAVTSPQQVDAGRIERQPIYPVAGLVLFGDERHRRLKCGRQLDERTSMLTE